MFDVALQLLRIRRALAVLRAVRAAPAGEQADAGRALVAHDVVGVVAVLRRAVGVHHARQAEPRAEVEQHRLEAAHVARAPRASCVAGSNTGWRIASAARVGVGDRAVEQRDRVEAFEIGRVGQHQVGVRDHLARVRVGIDDVRDAVFAASRRVSVSQCMRLARVHRRVPAHVGHEHQQRVDPVRIAAPTRCGSPCAACRARPAGTPTRTRGRCGAACRASSTSRSSGPCTKPSGSASSVPSSRARLAGPVRRRDRLRIRRLVAERTRRIDRAEQQLQQVQRAAGVEAVAVRADAAHRVHRHRPADHLRVLAAPGVGPRDRQHELAVERRLGQFARDAADGGGGDAAAFADRVGRVLRVEVAFGDQLEHRHRGAAVGAACIRRHRRRDADVAGMLASAPTSAVDSTARLPSASRANNPSSAPPGSRITSQCAFV